MIFPVRLAPDREPPFPGGFRVSELRFLHIGARKSLGASCQRRAESRLAQECPGARRQFLSGDGVTGRPKWLHAVEK
jgi:hypothetical protein